MSRLRRFLWYCVLLLPCMFLAAVLYVNGKNRVIVNGKGRASAPASSRTEISSRVETASAGDTRSVLAAGAETAIPASAENWGLSFPHEGEPPSGNATREALSQYGAYYLGDSSRKVIYLTFDCGYENGNTEKILDALKKHHAPGAFFVVGHMLESAPDVVRRMEAEGHIVGNHTFHHPDMSAIAAIEDFEEELAGVEALYREITGKELSRYYRPPQGKYSAENLRQAQALGYKTIFWSLAYVDWQQDKQPAPEEAYAKLLPRIHNGAIVLLHSTSGTNAEILDTLLTKWEEMGFSFASLDELPGV